MVQTHQPRQLGDSFTNTCSQTQQDLSRSTEGYLLDDDPSTHQLAQVTIARFAVRYGRLALNQER